MIDLHCHYLPAVDDGPQSLDESLDMARLAVADGISAAVLTPHVHPGRYENTLSTVRKAVETFRANLTKHGIPLNVHVGGEVRVCPEILDLLVAGDIPYIGTHRGFRVALFEFPHQLLPVGSSQFLSKMLDMKILPLIAHPERNKSIMHSPERIRPFVEMGCLLQLTAASVTGEFGEGASQAAHYFLKNDMAWVIASDAHNQKHRPPRMTRAWEVVKEQYGQRRADLLTRERPAQILGDVV